MRDVVFNSLEKRGVSFRDKNVLVCVSGGADSIALADFIVQNKQELCIKNIFVCHFNHGTRDKENFLEQQLVEDFCKINNVKMFVGFGRMNEISRPKGMSFEVFARNLRHDFFKQTAMQNDALILTAHNMNDRAETFLLNTIRGSGISGARSIEAVSQRAYRPLIDVSRQLIEDYCKKRSLKYATDSSNLSEQYSRNKIRLSVFPKLLEVNQKAVENISRFCDVAQEADNFLAKETQKLIEICDNKNGGFKTERFLLADEFLQKQLLKKLLFENSDNVTEKMINLILKAIKSKTTVQVEKNIFFVCENDEFRFETKQQNESTLQYLTQFKKGNLKLNSMYKAVCEIKLFEFSRLNEKNLKNVYNNCPDCGKIVGDLYFRTREQHDVFTSRRRNVSKKLKKLFNELKLTEQQKTLYPVLADDVGVVWVYGEGVDKRVAADEKTKSIININIELEV